MNLNRLLPALMALALLSACGKKPAPAPATATNAEPVKAEPAKTEPAKTEPAKTEPAKTEPAAEPAKTEPAKTEPAAEPAKAEPAPGEAPAAVDPNDPDDIGAAKYAACGGQGGNAAQLSPAFLDKMPGCDAPDTVPADKLAELGGDGKIIEGKGDCQYNAGISCHFHTSMEFVDSAKLKDDENAVGEMHCIVPSGDANSPTVYGAHLRCKAGTSMESGEASCSKDLLGALVTANCHDGWKCCDNGTLTKPVGKQSDGEKKLRPDFRICADAAIEIDCGLLHGMHGHTANVVGLGEEVNGKFNAPADEEHH